MSPDKVYAKLAKAKFYTYPKDGRSFELNPPMMGTRWKVVKVERISHWAFMLLEGRIRCIILTVNLNDPKATPSVKTGLGTVKAGEELLRRLKKDTVALVKETRMRGFDEWWGKTMGSRMSGSRYLAAAAWEAAARYTEEHPNKG